MDLQEEYFKIVKKDPSREGKLGTEDVAEISVREVRNCLLKESDWTQSRDLNLSNYDEWVNYRQSLRDLPEQPGWPLNVEWPIKPQ